MTLKRFNPLFKNHLAVCLCALFFSLPQSHLVNANEKTKQTETEAPKVKINFAPGYKKTSLSDSAAKDTYKRAIHHEIPKDTAPEQYPKIAEPLCLKFPPKTREKYFVTLFAEGRNAEVASYDCSEFDGATIIDAEKK